MTYFSKLADVRCYQVYIVTGSERDVDSLPEINTPRSLCLTQENRGQDNYSTQTINVTTNSFDIIIKSRAE